MKKLILSLFVLLFSIINFGYCDTVNDLIHKICPNGGNSCDYSFSASLNGSWSAIYQLDSNSTYCLSVVSSTMINQKIIFAFNNNPDNHDPASPFTYWTNWGSYVCFPGATYLLGKSNDRNVFTINVDLFELDDLLATALPVMTKGECQVEYNLIPVENVDQHYCETNDLCPEYEGDISTGGNLTGLDWSALYINNLQFPGKSIIDISIPDYITWDYSSSDEEFNLYVGSGYDQDYINSIIDINSYRPDSGDFTNIFVSGLTLIFPYIVVTLFIIFVWKLLKRIFK